MIGNLLKQIKSPSDLHNLNEKELVMLADEIRHLLKFSVGRNGGHLASNLGVVELTIALHYVFDFSHDRILWDVGHQSYVHKILTGRAEQFEHLRQEGGLSGFPDPRESKYDQFKVGHAGTAIPTALGLALGAQMQNTDEKIVAVVGDASIVNGVSFEGLNNTSLVKRQMLIILNDNDMAIDKTQGAFAQHLTRLRVSHTYEDLQKRTERMVRRLPYGKAIQDSLERLKGGIKTTLLGRHIFAQLGIPFYGPVDGHNLTALIKLFTALKNIEQPVIFHVCTQKGHGFAPASADPCAFHSTKPFVMDGEAVNFAESTGKSFTAGFSHILSDIMAKDKSVVALTAAMPDGTGLAPLREKYNNRIIDVGIAESAAVDIAAGLARKGLKPVVAIYSTFLQRSFDQIFQEVALQNLPVIFCVDRAGLVGGDGPTHHGFCDITMLRVLPGLVLMSPMDKAEMQGALEFALQSNKPCVIRYPRDVLPEPEQLPVGYNPAPFSLGKAAWIRKGSHAAIIAYGSVALDALQAAEILHKTGIEITVISARFAKPVDSDILPALLAENANMPIITLEDNALIGGFGSAILENAQQHKIPAQNIIRFGIPDKFIGAATRKVQLSNMGISAKSIADYISNLLTNCTQSPEAFSDMKQAGMPVSHSG